MAATVLRLNRRDQTRISHRHHSRAALLILACVLVLAACGSPTPTPSRGSEASDAAPIGPLNGIEPEDVRAHLEALAAVAAANGGVRTAGTAGYEASVAYAAGELRDLGYAVETARV